MGTPSAAASSLSQASFSMSKQRVREALEGSVACTAPRVSRHRSQVSTVPKASSPRSARARAPGTWSSSQAILVPEK